MSQPPPCRSISDITFLERGGIVDLPPPGVPSSHRSKYGYEKMADLRLYEKATARNLIQRRSLPNKRKTFLSLSQLCISHYPQTPRYSQLMEVIHLCPDALVTVLASFFFISVATLSGLFSVGLPGFSMTRCIRFFDFWTVLLSNVI